MSYVKSVFCTQYQNGMELFTFGLEGCIEENMMAMIAIRKVE